MLPTALFGLVLALFVHLHSSVGSELVVLLPGEDGHTGALVVERDGHRVVLDRPYAASRIEGDNMPRFEQLTMLETRADFRSALEALPQPPAVYLLHFELGTDTLTEESQGGLALILAELSKRPAPDILVIGHTDTLGTLDANDELSVQRAERVKLELVIHGIPAERIRTAGRGKRHLLVPTDDEVDEPRNRRVEINVR
jgi:outer membrane protein OmpA-like peptidoglycan-associated protein